ncbi:Rha family transcriptional regulator [Acinetobacter pittii]|uniref:Rha family transcriptional regulator n=1 Tax=Acinetobacter pittii TaxID=48296 RepID=UPI00301B441A
MTNLNINVANAVAINSNNQIISMTSQEISELLNSRHDNVKRSIERLTDSGIIELPPMEGIKNHLGQSVENYIFNGEQGKRDSIIVVAQLSPQFTAKLVDRWIELEKQAKPQFNLPATFSQALLLAAKLEEEKEQLVLQVAAQKQVIEYQQPSVDAYELLAGKKGSMCFTDAYKKLGGIKLKDMKKWLFEKNWLYKDRFNRENITYTYLMNGYLVEKETQYKSQIRITYKGLAALARQMKIKINVEDFRE